MAVFEGFRSGRFLLVAALALTWRGQPDAWAQIGEKKSEVPADQRVAEALSEENLKYRIDNDGDYVLSFQLENDRSHMVVIRSETEMWGKMEIREVFAYAYHSKTRLSQAKLEKLLKANARMKSGAWELIEGKEIIAVFSCKVAAACDGEALGTVVWGVAKSADQMEQTLSPGKDEN